MKNSFGNSLVVTLFGESHGEAIGAVIDGISPGIRISDEYIKEKLSRRRPSGKISTARVEADEYRIVSGVFGGYTTGTPLTIIIENKNTKSTDYSSLLDTPRPSHADFSAGLKYHGYQDYRGGGHFSGRITAALVAVGAILQSALLDKGISIGTHIKSLHGICDSSFTDYRADIERLASRAFPTLSEESEAKMKRYGEEIAATGDSVGGVLETAVVAFPGGVGEPWFDTLEGMLAHILFSVPAVKGVEFGLGFGFADALGSEANDPFRYENGKVVTETNSSGGINGGISNGMPLIFSVAVKPTPSICKEQNTVSLDAKENTTLKISGRHDPMIIHRAAPVVDAVTAIALADMLITRFGTDYLTNS